MFTFEGLQKLYFLKNLFLNENLWLGNIGYLLIFIAFVAALVGAIAFFISAQSRLAANAYQWKRVGVSAFWIHTLSIIGIFGLLFYLIYNHYFEYYYVWSHSSKQLPFKYLLSCFWEGQEGSFLLWATWHAVLGIILLKVEKLRTAPVMAVLCIVQVALTTTLLGIYIFGERIGSSPFLLLRQQMVGAPIFQQPDYLKFIEDGNGLNPLLQNYWMVIHPPILFLGFASTVVPFCYTIAALWKNNFNDWVKPVIRWSIFGCMILGTGIMMGGAWAYESLNFGGYWAWDPVENASLVPWLLFIAALHTTIIYKATQYSLRSTLLFFILVFILILYSTFLTRTGILGDTSVHSFTGEGKSLYYHLIVLLSFFSIGSLALLFLKWKKIPAPPKQEEEELSSREFWMFIGALVFIISVVQITYSTSMPVWNKLFNTKLTITNPIVHYNKIQLWIAICIAIISGFIYYLKFKKTSWVEVLKQLRIPLIGTAIIATIAAITQHINTVPTILYLIAVVFTILANTYYIIKGRNWNILKAGGNIAHAGFGILLLGILFSSFNKKVISINNSGIDLDLQKKTELENRKENAENVLLHRYQPVSIGNYYVTYLGDSVEGVNTFFKVDCKRLQNNTGKVVEQFMLYPYAQINPKMGLISSPGTKHYFTKDIFTYVQKTLDKQNTFTDTTSFLSKEVQKGDSLFFGNGYAVFRGFSTQITNQNYAHQSNDVTVGAMLDIYNLQGKQATLQPIYYIRDKMENYIEDTAKNFNLIVRFAKLIPSRNAALLEYKQPLMLDDFIILKAIEFPFINLVWMGTIIMVIGFLLSLYKRITVK